MNQGPKDLRAEVLTLLVLLAGSIIGIWLILSVRAYSSWLSVAVILFVYLAVGHSIWQTIGRLLGKLKVLRQTSA